jgi:hypothetical protein
MRFAIGFGVFLVLMAVLVVFVVRFAVQQGRRRQPRGPGPASCPPEDDGAGADGSAPEQDAGSS